MLSRLYIRNFAIITELEIQFQHGLVIITGETGAGKSILMGALGLALGERADASQIKDKEQKTIIEAEFKVRSNEELLRFFDEQELDWDDQVVIRREIQSNGKSRAFINDSPFALAQVQRLTSMLVDLHQQFDTLELSNKHFQQLILDARAGCLDELRQYTLVYNQFKDTERKIFAVKESIQRAAQEKEYKEFLLNELMELNWKPNEGKTIEEELNMLSNAEQIKQSVGSATFILTEGERPLVAEVKSLISMLQPLAKFHTGIEDLIQRLASAQVELKDIGSELNSISDKVTTDEKRLDELNARQSMAQRLMKKHGLQHVDELIQTQHALEQTLNGFEQDQSSLEKLQSELVKHEKAAMNIASKMHERRVKQSPLLEKATIELLSRVGMPNASIRIDLKETSLSPSGIDSIEFMFDANKSGRFEPLHKVASGGELSRLMLALKSLVAKSLEMPTLIFDEIDSGISGEAAKQVGILLNDLSEGHQLISITHQPQIAAKADQHLFVFKNEINGTVTTGIKELKMNERIHAIAQMLSGENPSEHALANAKEMIKA